MRTSATTTSRPARGFSLLEIMVVAALIGLLAAVAVPMITMGGGSRLEQQAGRLSGLLEQLNEQSLFVGELLAARLERHRVVPLRYSHEESAFVAMKGRSGGLSALELPAGMSLEWELEESERRGPALRDALGERLEDDPDRNPERERANRGGKSADPSEAASGEAEETLPQVFFFPSGEVTPVRLWLRDPDTAGAGIALELNSIGRVARPKTREETDAG